MWCEKKRRREKLQHNSKNPFRLNNGNLLQSVFRVYNLFESCFVATQNVVTLQNVVITTFCLATALTSIGKM